MYWHQNRWYSSFLSMHDHPEGLSDAFQVLTVRSGSQGTGGHVSMYLEMTVPNGAGAMITQAIDLTSVPGNPRPSVNIVAAQRGTALGQLTKDNLDGDRGPPELLQTHHTCYKINAAQSDSVLVAARRFGAKIDAGRYVYHPQGGVKARLATRPGIRGVNCADFVIKVLGETGIATLGYKFHSTPFRVAGTA